MTALERKKGLFQANPYKDVTSKSQWLRYGQHIYGGSKAKNATIEQLSCCIERLREDLEGCR